MMLQHAINEAVMLMKDEGRVVHTERWQAMDIGSKPEAQMVELLHHRLMADLGGNTNLDYYADQITPNLPWADDHFEERVCGAPINPGVEWKNWPWSNYADSSRRGEVFNHNYMERYWPKFAGMVGGPIETAEQWWKVLCVPTVSHAGIYHHYGDLSDLIQMLAMEPTTRQAYMPIWFPEDTGVAHSGRKPCTLGYHFIMRNNRLDIRYDIRSCDMTRHFRDDIYMTIRLGLYVLRRCQGLNPEAWEQVKPGKFIMNITSLHMFINDYYMTYKAKPHG